MPDLIVDAVVHDPQPEESEGCPDFKVTGTYKGQPFEWRVGISFEDRVFDIGTISGLEYRSIDPDEQADHLLGELFDKLNDSPAYKDVFAAYDRG